MNRYKHKHRPCPCGCGELADECMKPSSGLNAFSIGEAIDTFDRVNFAQRELERDEPPRRDALDDYVATLNASNHPPNECGDPYGCTIHAAQIQAHYESEPPS